MNVIKVHQTANQIIFQSILRDHGVTTSQSEAFIVPQVLNQYFLRHGL